MIIHPFLAAADMERDCDVAEEVARFVGYNKMPSTAIRGVAERPPHRAPDLPRNAD